MRNLVILDDPTHAQYLPTFLKSWLAWQVLVPRSLLHTENTKEVSVAASPGDARVAGGRAIKGHPNSSGYLI